MIPEFSLPFGWSSNKWSLVLSNMFAGMILIVLSHTNVLPLDDINFLFFSFIGLLFALYRPGWTFLLLVGMLPYEIINIAPENYSLTVRPYQWLLVLITISLVTRFALKRFPVEKFVPNVWDVSVIIFGLSAFLSAFMSDHRATALKLSVILFSFVVLYFVTRIFVRSLDDMAILVPFLLSSFLIVVSYAILQNIFFLNGKESFEVMAGRPNATFPEADWLGGYLAVVLVVTSALIASKKNISNIFRYIFSVFLFLGYIALLLTVSRSAWLATFFGIMSILFLYAWQHGVWRALLDRNRIIILDMLWLKLFIVIPFFLAFFVVYFSSLSPFDLLDRSKSTATGDQKITIACEKVVVLPQKITDLNELATFGCEHIRLEEKESQKSSGKYVAEIFRNDPNVHIRADIYTKVIDAIKNNFLFGIGFGNISLFLGTDERGTGLNASNIFLEVWLGTGFIGSIAFLFFWFGLGIKWFREGIKEHSFLAVMFVSLFVTLTVFNLFNSGLFLGFFFFCMALFLSNYPISHRFIDEEKEKLVS
ncbi:MAG: O-antigen ligase family protein [Candidatus Moraniibacteriota bacterium]